MATIGLKLVGTAIGGPIGGFIGAAVGSFIDRALFSKDKKMPDQIGPRISDLSVQFSSYGQPIPICYGRVRMAGNIIWAQNIKEVEVRETSTGGGGKGGGGGAPSQTTVSFQYFATIAIAICEGEIDSIERIWADTKILTSKELNASSGKYNIYRGTEDQLPDPIMESFDGSGEVPAYRGIAYVVIQDFPLAAFGNRIPNFTFEVKRTLNNEDSVEKKIKEINLIPGCGEFVYSMAEYSKQSGYEIDHTFRANDVRKTINLHNYNEVPNAKLAIDQMLTTFPNLEWVGLVVSWFATSLDAGACDIVPKVEYPYAEGIYVNKTFPYEWSVGGYSRVNAQAVLRFEDGTLTYGGTPSDRSIIEMCQYLNEKGIKIMLYPFIMVDTLTPEVKPWRGRIIPANATDANNFFTKTNGLNNFILHYANLSVDGVYLKDLIDGFVIGSEMVGLTTFSSSAGVYPAVTKLAALAEDVKDIVGSDVTVTYAANWSEYHSWDGYYHMDELWTSPGIDVVSIDAYFPLTPDLPQTEITPDKIKEYWEKGEGWDYFYSDAEARTGKTDYSDPEFAWKNVEYWWSHAHSNGGTPTGWTAKLKPIWFTEFGFGSVDGTANQPNIFVDPTSDESGFPRMSKQRVDYTAQREAINATLDFLQERSAEVGKSGLVPKAFLWTFDARPYPFFPDLTSVWSDGANYPYGHWVQGKLGAANLGDIASELIEKVNLTSEFYDVSQLNDTVEGYVINNRQPLRDSLSLLASAYFFDAVESSGKIKFIKRGKATPIDIDEQELIPISDDSIKQITEKTRRPDLELPASVDISYISRASNFNTGTQTSRRQTVDAVDKISLTLPLVLSDQTAKVIADKSLYTSWNNRTSYKFRLMPKYQYLDATDLINVVSENGDYLVRVGSISLNKSLEVDAVGEDISTYDFYLESSPTPQIEKPGGSLSETTLYLLDLPLLPGDVDNGMGTLRIAASSDSENWSGCTVFISTDGGEEGGNTFTSAASITSKAIVGSVLSEVEETTPFFIDETTEIQVTIRNGTLSSITDTAFDNGGNLALIGGELIQFQNAELIGTNLYSLTNILRGKWGTESEMGNHEIGEDFILLDSSIAKIDIPLQRFNNTTYFKAVTYGNTVADTTEGTFIYEGNNLRPYSPVHITGTRNEDLDIELEWVRRTRISAGWNAPLAEETEEYFLEIYDGADVVRTATTTSSTYTYTADEQTEDFGSPQSELDVKIYQMSALVGRGYPGIETI